MSYKNWKGLPVVTPLTANDRILVVRDGHERFVSPTEFLTGDGLAVVSDRLTDLESSIPSPEALNGLNDRLTDLETSIPSPEALNGLNDRINGLASSIPSPQVITGITDRVTAVEAKVPAPGVIEGVNTRISTLENAVPNAIPSRYYPHKYWRVAMYARGADNADLLINGIDFHPSATDQTVLNATGNGDGLFNTVGRTRTYIFNRTQGGPIYQGWQFLEPVKVGHLTVYGGGNPGDGPLMPEYMILQYSDDGVTYYDGYIIDTSIPWDPAEVRYYTLPLRDTFLALDDTPKTYGNVRGSILSVNEDGTGLEFKRWADLQRDSGKHIYWRLKIKGDQVDDGYPSTVMSGIQFRETVGGPNIAIPSLGQDDPVQATGTIFGTLGLDMARAFRGVGNWTLNGAQFPHYVGFEFLEPVKIAEVSLTSSQFSGSSPTAFDIEYSDDNVLWFKLTGFSGITPWNQYEQRFYEVPFEGGFLSLGDTPDTYINNSGKVLRVKEDGSGLEFIDGSKLLDFGNGKHKYWQVVILSTVSANISLAGIQFRDKISVGANLFETVGFTYVGDGQYPAALTDNNPNTVWYGGSSTTIPHDANVHPNFPRAITFRFDEPVTVAEVRIMVSNVPSDGPTGWTVNYSDDGAYFEPAAVITDHADWKSVNEERVYTVPAKVGLLALPDFPSNYGGNEGAYLRVKEDASGMEFSDMVVPTKLTDLTDFPTTYANAAGQAVRVKAGGEGVEFFTPLTDAPADGKLYARRGSSWALVDADEANQTGYKFWKLDFTNVRSPWIGLNVLSLLGKDETKTTGATITSNNGATAAWTDDDDTTGNYSRTGSITMVYQFATSKLIERIRIKPTVDYGDAPTKIVVSGSPDGATYVEVTTFDGMAPMNTSEYTLTVPVVGSLAIPIYGAGEKGKFLSNDGKQILWASPPAATGGSGGGGGSGGAVGPHRYWRVRMWSFTGNATIAKIKLKATAGGTPIPATVLRYSSVYSGSESAQNVVDYGNAGSVWSMAGADTTPFVDLDLGTASNVAEIEFVNRSDQYYGQAPKIADLYFSDDGLVFIPVCNLDLSALPASAGAVVTRTVPATVPQVAGASSSGGGSGGPSVVAAGAYEINPNTGAFTGFNLKNIASFQRLAQGVWRLTWTTPIPTHCLPVMSGQYLPDGNSMVCNVSPDRHSAYVTDPSLVTNMTVVFKADTTIYDPSYFQFVMYDLSTIV